MRTLKILVCCFIVLLSLAACSEKIQTPASIGLQEQQFVDTTDCHEIKGDLPTAQSALNQGDLFKANCIASKIFNESVEMNPEQPDTQAAFIAGQARLGLLVESAEVKYLLITDPSHQDLKASDYFGASGHVQNLEEIFKERWGYSGPLPEWQGILYNFLKAHQNLGHSTNDLLDHILSLIGTRFGDLHLLSKAIAKDGRFKGAIKEFLQLPDAVDFNNTEGAIANMWFNAARTSAKIAFHYNTGLDDADHLLDPSLLPLMEDLNASAQLLSLRGPSSEMEALPLIRLTLQGIVLAITNSKSLPPQNWAKNFLPKSDEDRLNLLVIAQQLQSSLDEDKVVWLVPSDNKFGINIMKALRSLPDSAEISEPVVKLDGGNIELNENFVKKFISGFTEQL